MFGRAGVPSIAVLVALLAVACAPSAPPASPTAAKPTTALAPAAQPTAAQPAAAQPAAPQAASAASAGSGAAAAVKPGAFEELLEAVKKESGQIVVVDTLPTDPQQQQAIADAFNKRFGLSVKVQWLNEHNIAHFPKLITDLKAGRPGPDVETWDTYQVPIANRQVPDTFKPYDWVGTFGEVLPGIRQNVEQVRVPEVRGSALAVTDLLYAIGFNTKSIAKSDVPSSFEELADPKWNGKFGLQSISAAPFHVLALDDGWGFDKTDRVLASLMANKPFLKRGSPALIDSIALGEVPMGIASLGTLDALRQDGKPVDFRAVPLIPSLQQVLAVTEGPQQKNVNTARLFTAWYLTEGKPFLWRLGKGLSVDHDWPVIKGVLEDNPNAKFVSAASLQNYTQMEDFNNRLYKKYYPGAG